jgi:hypothetical protein
MSISAGLAPPARAEDPPQYFDDQPVNRHSSLSAYAPTVDFPPSIGDAEFARWMVDLLTKDGLSKCLHAKFLFQECYSGGMLDELKEALLGTVRFVGGASARYDELSWGQLSTPENAILSDAQKLTGIFVNDPPLNFWTEVLDPELRVDQTMITGINNARANDRVGVNGGASAQGHMEHGQSIYGTGGEIIKLADSDAAAHYAIIYIGDATNMRHYYDVESIRNTLINQWSGSTYAIHVLFGNGKTSSDGKTLPAGWNAKDAYKTTLKTTVNSIAASINSNDEFFFYGGDHGGEEVETIYVTPVNPHGIHHDHFGETVGALEGMWFDQMNAPSFTVRHQGVVGPFASVWLNGYLLGYLDPGALQTVFPVDENIVNLDNEFEIRNENPAPMLLESGDFYTGSIEPDPALLSSAKRAGDGVAVKVSRAVVTAVLAAQNCFYIENTERTCGIRVQGSAGGLFAGDLVDVLGTISTNEFGERYIACERALVVESGCEVTPLAMPGKSIGGGNWFYNHPSTGAGQMGVYGASGLNNIGLLVRTCGWVLWRDEPAGRYVIRDGSFADVPGWFPGIVVFVPPGGYVPPVGAFRTVTGISSRYGTYEDGYRRILALPGPM